MRRTIFLAAVTAALWAGAPALAAAETAASEAAAALQQRLDFVWVLAAAALVFMMQAGFLLLEAGMVRTKNSINVAQKNFLDFMFSTLFFAVVGFMFGFGKSAPGVPVGFDAALFMLNAMSPWLLAFFVFQVMFCGTAATIVSGAVAERMRLSSYVLCAVIMGAFIYPVFMHWAWGAALGPNDGAFLANMGYVDFAGSTVVHATGGWISLAACIVLGARIGRFGPNGEPRRMAGHNPVLATTGAIVLFFGWIGFNGGSTLAANTDIAGIIANTVLAGAAGGAAGYLFGLWQDGVALPEKAVNGAIAGLVAVTAGCAVLTVPGALAIGVIGALAAQASNDLLERRFRIDDAVGAIGVHGAAGAAGTIGLALLAPAANLPAGAHLAQLGVQSLGVALNFAWAFGVGLAFFWTLNKVMRLRVHPGEEEVGLNEAEHATRLGIGHVEDAFGALANGVADLNMRLPVEPGDEAERMTRVFNALMDKLQQEEAARERLAEKGRSAAESERLSALANTTFESLCICVDGRIIDANAAFCALLGAPLDAIKGSPLRDFVAREHWPVIDTPGVGDAAHGEIAMLSHSGETIPVEMRGREIIYRGVATRVFALIDLRERKAAEARIRFLAQHEPLSNLPNRALFNEELVALTERATRDGMMSAVLLIDLDRFKDINDLHGHGAGDEVIKATADRLRAAVRRGDMVARLGGDEFGILQRDIDFAAQASDLAHRLVQDLSRPIALPDGAQVRAGASIGVAICPRDGIEAPRLVSRADTALYHAKNCGRNSFAVFEEGMDVEIRRRQMLEADLSLAIEREEFQVHFQPRLRIADGHIGAYEALIRWPHPDKGWVSPAEFIAVAEHSGRIVKIGEWVLHTACRIAAQLLGDARVSVNVSPLQIRERHFIDRVAAALEHAGLAPARLEIEITESVLIDDDQRALHLLRDLKKLGVGVALDDFGTGYSSLGYLSRFPFDTIKIDRSFISGMAEEANARAIVETIIRLGRALNITIVAEGVETAEDLHILAASGCDELQGYLIGAAQPAEQALRTAPEPVLQALGVADLGPQERAVLALQRRVAELLDAMPSRTDSAPRRRDARLA